MYTNCQLRCSHTATYECKKGVAVNRSMSLVLQLQLDHERAR
jgi:hypothetical protein